MKMQAIATLMPTASAILSYTLAALLFTTVVISQELKNEDLESKADATVQGSSFTPTSGRSASSRAGRMLDLDRLSGDISKADKTAARSISGQRQSRILSEDIQAGSLSGKQLDTEKMGRTKKSKKMAIKGFIPIISLEAGKDGKHLESHLADATGGFADNDDDEENEQASQFAAGNQQNTRDQLMSNFGGQTSLGHASFAVPQPTMDQQQQQYSGDQLDQQGGRANRKLIGANGILSGPRRLVSTLVPQLPFGSSQTLQGPMNMPPMQMAGSSIIPQGECICVPFFQCKNGYLSESQLSKSQLQQILGHQASSLMSPNFANSYQVPRSLATPMSQQHHQLATNSDLYYSTSPAPISSLMSQLEQQRGQQQLSNFNQRTANEQQIANDIYEQLRKKIEGENLEQQLQLAQQQQANLYPQIDERSKVSASQQQTNSSSGKDVEERSLLNTLGRRSSNSQQRCGIMRTCCRIPPSLFTGEMNSAGQHQQPSIMRLQQNARLNGVGHAIAQPNLLARPQSQYQMIQGPQQLANPFAVGQISQPPQQPFDYQQANTGLVSSMIDNPTHQQQQLAPQRPQGVFMGGRCGVKSTIGISGRVQNAQPAPGSESTADFGEFPAHAAILRRISPGDSLFVCSAVLVSNQWLATAAHCVKKLRPDELKVRLGEWDVNRDDEFYPFIESHVREIIIHPDFQPTSLSNDVALLRIDATLDAQQSPHIAPACLASVEENWAGHRCWVAGWGKDAFGQSGTFQSILHKVDLPVVGRQDCEMALRYQTKLGKMFRLHSSSICAGGERGKDACEGDGGAGLYCTELESGLTKVVGLVSWGVGCGQRGVPGVYSNIGSFQQWIESVIMASGEDSLFSSPINGISDGMFKNLVSERSNGATNVTNTTTTKPASQTELLSTVDSEETNERSLGLSAPAQSNNGTVSGA